jgi:hypothetical protein
MADVQPGQRWRLVNGIGNTVPVGENADAVPLPSGIVGVVRELVPAEVPGAHNFEEDCAILEFPMGDVTYENGVPQLIQTSRAVSFGLQHFDDPGYFAQVGEGE